MATVSTFRTMMNRLGFSKKSANHIFDEQGTDLLEEIAFLSIEGTTNLLKTVRCGGHQIIDSNDEARTIPVPGFLVSNLAEDNFNLLAYYLRHTEITSRTVNMVLIERSAVRALRSIRKQGNNHEETEKNPLVFTGN